MTEPAGILAVAGKTPTPRVTHRAENRRATREGRPVIEVLIVDDHRYVRQGLEELFGQTQDIHVVAGCADGWEALAAVLLTEPDVVLMELARPGMTGLEASRHLLARRPDVREVRLPGTVTAAGVGAAWQIGVAGHLLRDDDPGGLPALIRTAAAGRAVWSSTAAARLARCD
jgi:DNA-binding NarL/FixJ family response regulator